MLPLGCASLALWRIRTLQSLLPRPLCQRSPSLPLIWLLARTGAVRSTGTMVRVQARIVNHPPLWEKLNSSLPSAIMATRPHLTISQRPICWTRNLQRRPTCGEGTRLHVHLHRKLAIHRATLCLTTCMMVWRRRMPLVRQGTIRLRMAHQCLLSRGSVAVVRRIRPRLTHNRIKSIAAGPSPPKMRQRRRKERGGTMRRDHESVNRFRNNCIFFYLQSGPTSPCGLPR